MTLLVLFGIFGILFGLAACAWTGLATWRWRRAARRARLFEHWFGTQLDAYANRNQRRGGHR